MVRAVAVGAAALLGAGLTQAPLIAAPWQLPRSDVLTVAGSDGHAYRIAVAWPEGAPPPGGWPVLWVLDGEDNFALAAQTARRLARGRGDDGVAPGLVVAIDSGPLARRVVDYTPPVPGYRIAEGLPAHGLAVGGADDFLAFIARQVRPLIAARWRLDTTRETLAGHSFGGLLALYDVARHGDFDRYAAISPSFWYAEGRTLGVASQAHPDIRVLILAAEAEGGPAAASGTSGEAAAARLRAAGLSAAFRALPGQSHGTTMIAAMPDIVKLAFGKVQDR